MAAKRTTASSPKVNLRKADHLLHKAGLRLICTRAFAAANEGSESHAWQCDLRRMVEWAEYLEFGWDRVSRAEFLAAVSEEFEEAA